MPIPKSSLWWRDPNKTASGKTGAVQTEETSLLPEDEARRLPLEDIIMVVDAQMPIRAKRIQYYDDPFFKAIVYLTNPGSDVRFRLTTGQQTVGYNALLLPQVCEVYLRARDAGALLASQLHIVERAEILIRGLATVGIIALVDEATGYQRPREERALATPRLNKARPPVPVGSDNGPCFRRGIQPHLEKQPLGHQRELVLLPVFDGQTGR